MVPPNRSEGSNTVKIEIHHYHHYPELENMSQQLADIQREVQEAKDAQTSAVVLITGLRDRINQLIDSATELGELKTQLGLLTQDLSDSTDGLAAAVAEPGNGEGGNGEQNPPA